MINFFTGFEMIYVSTGGHKNWSFDQTMTHLLDVGINAFELSGGEYISNVEEKIKRSVTR